MKMSKLSNQTNSQDPQAVNSRIFVGNLNTFQCSKTDVERMFQRYGRLAGISMHKGYAFVQFTNPFDARNACHGEDGRTVLSQTLDVNMVAEPKPHQIGRKRQNVTKTGNDWDYYYDSYCASTLLPTNAPRPIKRQRLMGPQQQQLQLQQNRLTVSVQQINGKVNLLSIQPSPQNQQQQMTLPTSPLPNGSHNNANGHNGAADGVVNGNGGDPQSHASQHLVNGQQLFETFKVYSNPDTLICGNCRESFSNLSDLLDHKRTYCKLRFTCKCHQISSDRNFSNYPRLLCVVCKDPFSNPWDLMVHAQTAHMINIYELGNDTGPSTTTASDAPDTATSKDEAPSTKDASDAPEDISSQSATNFKEDPDPANPSSTDVNLFEETAPSSSPPSPVTEDTALKVNGSVSSQKDSREGSASPCIVGALSIEPSANPTHVKNPTALELITPSTV
ncbi:uncharacterized protein LOC129800366 isoform X2 [Phlebotomus papatasi]|uniref:uncharacterized protein LOC129800366 isoform X2 n=1 Tax=Phlebotomus papatasi TaxID=29031 RepID=UPI002484241C|nr:uncharacterized protein LOC129800366 isoform X2 [Phlebotomus papatasi]